MWSGFYLEDIQLTNQTPHPPPGGILFNIQNNMDKFCSEKKGFCGYTVKTVIPVIENRQDVGVASPSKVRCVSFFFLLVSAES